MKTLLTTELDLVNKLKSNGHKMFSITFTKKDNTERDMLCRLKVKKNLKGTGMKYDPSKKGMLTVWDMHKNGYRTITIANISRLKMCGTEYRVRVKDAGDIMI